MLYFRLTEHYTADGVSAMAVETHRAAKAEILEVCVLAMSSEPVAAAAGALQVTGCVYHRDIAAGSWEEAVCATVLVVSAVVLRMLPVNTETRDHTRPRRPPQAKGLEGRASSRRLQPPDLDPSCEVVRRP